MVFVCDDSGPTSSSASEDFETWWKILCLWGSRSLPRGDPSFSFVLWKDDEPWFLPNFWRETSLGWIRSGISSLWILRTVIWSIIEAFNVNLVGFQFEGHMPYAGHLEASNSENVASASGAGAASFDVDSMPALPWKNAGKNHSRLQDNSYSRQKNYMDSISICQRNLGVRDSYTTT